MLDDPNAPQDSQITRQTLRDMFPVIMLGFVLVVIGLFVFLWPTGAWGAEGTITVPHLQRLLGTGLPDTGIALTRRILDASIYLIIVVGIGFVVVGLRRGNRDSLLGLIAVAILGLAYVAGQALYSGPMMSACGFLFILFGSLIAWVVSSVNGPPDRPDEPNNSDPSDPTSTVENLEVGNHDYASSSVA